MTRPLILTEMERMRQAAWMANERLKKCTRMTDREITQLRWMAWAYGEVIQAAQEGRKPEGPLACVYGYLKIYAAQNNARAVREISEAQFQDTMSAARRRLVEQLRAMK